MQLRVKAIAYEAEDILSLDLRAPDGAPLPAFTAGAHIELHLANGLRRQYSLANPQTERHRYRIGVLKDAAGRGGSRFVHDTIRPGDILTIEEPRNNFPLQEDAAHTVLIAGGIGIAPVWCMAQRLHQLSRSWTLHYAARTQARAAFLDEMKADSFHLHCDDAHGGHRCRPFLPGRRVRNLRDQGDRGYPRSPRYRPHPGRKGVEPNHRDLLFRIENQPAGAGPLIPRSVPPTPPPAAP